jgi:toxin secretion/phage lysis holin
MTNPFVPDSGRLSLDAILSKGAVLDVLKKAVINNHALKTFLVLLILPLHWMFGKSAQAVITVACLICVDTMTGFVKASKKDALSSSGFFRAATKFIVYLLLMSGGALVDKVLPVAFACPMMVVFLAITEMISIMENAGEAGFPVPTALLKHLKVMRDKAEGPDGRLK